MGESLSHSAGTRLTIILTAIIVGCIPAISQIFRTVDHRRSVIRSPYHHEQPRQQVSHSRRASAHSQTRLTPSSNGTFPKQPQRQPPVPPLPYKADKDAKENAPASPSEDDVSVGLDSSTIEMDRFYTSLR